MMVGLAAQTLSLKEIIDLVFVGWGVYKPN